MKEYTVHNWVELEHKLFEDGYDSKVKRYRSNFVFRGMSDSSYDLGPIFNNA